MAPYKFGGTTLWIYIRGFFTVYLMPNVLLYYREFKSLRPLQPAKSRSFVQTTPEEVVLRICNYLLAERESSSPPLTYARTDFQRTTCAMSRVQRAWNYAVIPELYKEITINSPRSLSCLVRTLEDPKCEALAKLVLSCISMQSSRIHRSGCAGYDREEEDKMRRIYKACPNLCSMDFPSSKFDSCCASDYASHFGMLTASSIATRSVLLYMITRLDIKFNVTKPCINNGLFTKSLVLPTLQELQIHGSTGFWTQCRKVLQLPTMPQLRRLVISNWMSWAPIIVIEGSPRLHTLEFFGGSCLNIDGLLAGFMHAASSIEALSLSCKIINHQCMFYSLRRFTGLTDLCIPIALFSNVLTEQSWSTLQRLTLVSSRDNNTDGDEMGRATDCIRAKLQDNTWRSELRALQRLHICVVSLQNARSSLLWTKIMKLTLASRIQCTVCCTNSMHKDVLTGCTSLVPKPSHGSEEAEASGSNLKLRGPPPVREGLAPDL